jgi:hypothetical protein
LWIISGEGDFLKKFSNPIPILPEKLSKRNKTLRENALSGFALRTYHDPDCCRDTKSHPANLRRKNPLRKTSSRGWNPPKTALSALPSHFSVFSGKKELISPFPGTPFYSRS